MLKLGATAADLVISVKHMKIIKVVKDVKVLKALIP
jgi:hypothetical protein